MSRSISFWLPLFVVLGAAGPARALDHQLDIPSLVTSSLEVYNELSDDPLPFLTGKQLEQLARGDVVRIRRRPTPTPDGSPAPERVTGFIVVERPRIEVWLAALDPEFRLSNMLTEVRLQDDGAGASRWYQHVALPWPIADRHWVIDLGRRIDLSTATEGFVWEADWALVPDGPAIAARTVADGLAEGLTPESIADAVYVPANEGAWILFSIDERVTLLAYRVVAVVGGGIPDSWITTFAMAQLEGLLKDVARHAGEIGSTYDPARTPIFGGDGALIPRIAAAER